jgi:hypothetical protein
VTTIELSGDSLSNETNTFRDAVNITLTAREQGEIRSGVSQIQYSVDCGQNWTIYDGPFTVTLETPHSCGEGGVGQQGVELGPNDFILLAMSEDSVKNIEQPPAQAQFAIQ